VPGDSVRKSSDASIPVILTIRVGRFFVRASRMLAGLCVCVCRRECSSITSTNYCLYCLHYTRIGILNSASSHSQFDIVAILNSLQL